MASNAASGNWVDIQQNTFNRWINTHLRKRGLKCDDMAKDFQNGVLLCHLMEIISGKTIAGWKRDPKSPMHQQENCHLAIAFIKSEGLKIVNIGGDDIFNCRLKLILGLIWTIILRYQIRQRDGPGASEGAGVELLKWVQMMLANGKSGVKVNNFVSDWNDGKAICALVDALSPGMCPGVSKMDSKNALDNATKGVDLAETKLNIPKLLYANEMVNPRVDDKAVMTYLSQFRDTFEAAAQCTWEGDGLSTGMVNHASNFSVTAPNNTGKLEVRVKGPGGDVKYAVEAKGNTQRFTYTPTQEGIHQVTVTFDGVPIPGSTFSVHVAPDEDEIRRMREKTAADHRERERKAQEEAERLERERREREEKEKRDREAREKAEREAREAREKAEREAREAREKAERDAREARDKAEREAREAREKADREAREKAEREAREAREKAEREAREAREKAERDAREAKEKADRDVREIRERAEREAKEIRDRAEREAREMIEKAQREAREKAIREAKERVEAEEHARVQAEVDRALREVQDSQEQALHAALTDQVDSVLREVEESQRNRSDSTSDSGNRSRSHSRSGSRVSFPVNFDADHVVPSRFIKIEERESKQITTDYGLPNLDGAKISVPSRYVSKAASTSASKRMTWSDPSLLAKAGELTGGKVGTPKTETDYSVAPQSPASIGRPSSRNATPTRERAQAVSILRAGSPTPSSTPILSAPSSTPHRRSGSRHTMAGRINLEFNSSGKITSASSTGPHSPLPVTATAVASVPTTSITVTPPSKIPVLRTHARSGSMSNLNAAVGTQSTSPSKPPLARTNTSRPSSRQNSRPNSRSGSRPGSRSSIRSRRDSRDETVGHGSMAVRFADDDRPKGLATDGDELVLE